MKLIGYSPIIHLSQPRLERLLEMVRAEAEATKRFANINRASFRGNIHNRYLVEYRRKRAAGRTPIHEGDSWGTGQNVYSLFPTQDRGQWRDDANPIWDNLVRCYEDCR